MGGVSGTVFNIPATETEIALKTGAKKTTRRPGEQGEVLCRAFGCFRELGDRGELANFFTAFARVRRTLGEQIERFAAGSRFEC